MNEPQTEKEITPEEIERIIREERDYYIRQGIEENGMEY